MSSTSVLAVSPRRGSRSRSGRPCTPYGTGGGGHTARVSESPAWGGWEIAPGRLPTPRHAPGIHHGEYPSTATTSSDDYHAWSRSFGDPRSSWERFIHDAGCELRRIPLPRTPVNRGKEKGRCGYAPAPCTPLWRLSATSCASCAAPGPSGLSRRSWPGWWPPEAERGRARSCRR